MYKKSIVLSYSSFYDDKPLELSQYISNIDRDILLDYAIWYCNIKDTSDIYYGFLKPKDEGTEFYRHFTTRANQILSTNNDVSIINTRSSLCFLEQVLALPQKEIYRKTTDVEVRECIFKAYLTLGSIVSEMRDFPDDEPFENITLQNALHFELYREHNFLDQILIRP